MPEVRHPDGMQPSPRNDRINWVYPRPASGALYPTPQREYLGTPTFIVAPWDADEINEFIESGHGQAAQFKPARPNGMLAIKLFLRHHDLQLESRLWSGGTVNALSHDGAFVYSHRTGKSGRIQLAIPYSYRPSEVIGVEITGPDMLPVEAIISQFGTIPSFQSTTLRKEILSMGFASPVLYVFPASHSNFRHATVVDADGAPVADAMLTFDGVQILGRSDQSGLLRFPWQPARENAPENNRIREKYFFVSAPGYVPLLLERAELESATAPVQVVLRAPELLISAHHTVPDPSALKLGLSGMSFILGMGGRDLIPIPDDHPAVDTWEDVFVITHHRGDFDRLQRFRSLGWQEADSTQLWRSNFDLAASFKPGDKFGGFGARKLGEVLGRTPSSSWEAYSKWYYGRWDYDEREGRFDVALPYAGRFLLLVGEYHSAKTADYADGALTHALYIDARDPANLKSKLIIHPKG